MKQNSQTRLSITQGAEMLGISPHTMRAWVRERRVPYYRLGRRILLDATDLVELLKRSRVEAVRH